MHDKETEQEMLVPAIGLTREEAKKNSDVEPSDMAWDKLLLTLRDKGTWSVDAGKLTYFYTDTAGQKVIMGLAEFEAAMTAIKSEVMNGPNVSERCTFRLTCAKD